MASRGRGARAKGHAFERRIANDMRQIYDTPELTAKLAAVKTPAQRAALQKRSTVRRGRQGEGAAEPDIVTPTLWWMECQSVTHEKHYQPVKKLEQAERDAPEGWRPVSICHLGGKHTIEVCMRSTTLMELAKARPGLKAESILMWDVLEELPIMIDYKDFLSLLRLQKES